MGYANDVCQRCKKGGRLMKCGKCHSTLYCSRNCQKLDWQAGHRQRCRLLQMSTTAKAFAALQELEGVISRLSLSEADRNFHSAIREIERLQQHETSALGLCDRSIETNVQLPMRNVQENITHKSPINQQPEHQTSVNQSYLSKVPCSARVGYVVEQMSHISCYQIRLTSCLSEVPLLKFDGLDHSTKQSVMASHSVLVLHRKEQPDDAFFCLQLPGVSKEQNQETSIMTDPDGHLIIRVPMVSHLHYNDDVSVSSSLASTPSIAVSSIQCRFCKQYLIKQNNQITTSLPLPSGNWDEITDYLSCFESPLTDFATVSLTARPSLSLEDASVLVLHKSDLGETVCTLAVEAYGEDSDNLLGGNETQVDSVLNRGSRSWRNAVTGTALCCSQCCAPLGVASGESLETLRLWKHCLTTAGNELSRYSVASFLAHEMVRYAESKAVFTFVAVMPSVLQQASFKKPCLLLRLLRWDTRLAFSDDSSRDDKGIDTLRFKRFAKVIYEESTEPSMPSSDVTSWKWGGIELCCAVPEMIPLESRGNLEPPDQSSVRICLPSEEWLEVRRVLEEGSKLFSKDVAAATIMVKVGKAVRQGDSVGLSILPLI